MLLKSVLVLFLSVSSIAFAGLQEDFEALKSVPRDYTDSGSICEEVARLRIAEEYPAPQYTVEVGIAYGNAERTIGELDIVIFDNNMHKAIKMGEVKCWKDARAGLKKAQDQRARFLKNARSSGGHNLQFVSTATHQRYDAEQLIYVNEFIAIAQKGTMSAGYDMEMEYTLNEFKALRMKMIQCQQRGECAKP